MFVISVSLGALGWEDGAPTGEEGADLVLAQDILQVPDLQLPLPDVGAHLAAEPARRSTALAPQRFAAGGG